MRLDVFKFCMQRAPFLRLPLRMLGLRLVKPESLVDILPLHLKLTRRMGKRVWNA